MLSTFATGLVMGESPRWHDGALWVCGWMAGGVLRFDTDRQSSDRPPRRGVPVLDRLAR